MRTRQRLASVILLAWATSCLFVVRAGSQAVEEETLVGPDSREIGQGPHGHLLEDWGGLRSRLQQRGVRFDFQYVTDSLWNIKSEQKERFASWNRVRGTVDIDFGALTDRPGFYFHATALRQGGGNLGTYLGLLTSPSGMSSQNTFRLDSWWVEKRWLNQRLAARVGQFAEQDFYGAQHYAASFIFEPMGFFLQPLCAALLAGIIGALAVRFQLSSSLRLVAVCPCMILVPGPHFLKGMMDLSLARPGLGASRLVYAGMVVLAICAGLLLEDTDRSKGETRATVVHAKSGGDYRHLATSSKPPSLPLRLTCTRATSNHLGTLTSRAEAWRGIYETVVSCNSHFAVLVILGVDADQLTFRAAAAARQITNVGRRS